MFTPCKGCSERVVGCHTQCKKYKQYREQVDARAAAIKEIRREPRRWIWFRETKK